MLVTKTTSGKDLIVLGERALVGNIYIDIKSTHNEAWRRLAGEDEVAELHQLLADNAQQWGDNEKDWRQALTHDNEKVRTLLAQHAKSLNILKLDPSATVREAVVIACFNKLDFGCGSNQGFYQGIIKYLLDDCFTDNGVLVACAIAERANEVHLNHIEDDVMLRLAKHPVYLVRERVARHTTDSSLLEVLSFDSDEFVRMQVAQNHQVTRGTLERLSNDTDFVVRAFAKVD